MTPLDSLSSRERDVVNLLMEGKSNKLMASALHISERTVEFHLKNIYAKYQVSSRTELILKLGKSTVAGQGQTAENGDRSNLWSWTASLRKAVSRIGQELKLKMDLNSNASSTGRPMTFFESILICLKKYADFNGRASRSEFWWFMLFVVLAASALVYISEDLGSIFLIAVLLPLLAAGARRLRDIDKSAWWLFFILVPIGGIITLGILWAQPPTNPPADDVLAA